MGTVNPRLQRIRQAVRPEARLPVIITLTQPPTPEIIQRIQQTTGQPARPSEFLPLVFTSANEAQTQQLSQLPGVKEVTPDEPTTPL